MDLKNFVAPSFLKSKRRKEEQEEHKSKSEPPAKADAPGTRPASAQSTDHTGAFSPWYYQLQENFSVFSFTRDLNAQYEQRLVRHWREQLANKVDGFSQRHERRFEKEIAQWQAQHERMNRVLETNHLRVECVAALFNKTDRQAVKKKIQLTYIKQDHQRILELEKARADIIHQLWSASIDQSYSSNELQLAFELIHKYGAALRVRSCHSIAHSSITRLDRAQREQNSGRVNRVVKPTANTTHSSLKSTLSGLDVDEMLMRMREYDVLASVFTASAPVLLDSAFADHVRFLGLFNHRCTLMHLGAPADRPVWVSCQSSLPPRLGPHATCLQYVARLEAKLHSHHVHAARAATLALERRKRMRSAPSKQSDKILTKFSLLSVLEECLSAVVEVIGNGGGGGGGSSGGVPTGSVGNGIAKAFNFGKLGLLDPSDPTGRFVGDSQLQQLVFKLGSPRGTKARLRIAEEQKQAELEAKAAANAGSDSDSPNSEEYNVTGDFEKKQSSRVAKEVLHNTPVYQIVRVNRLLSKVGLSGLALPPAGQHHFDSLLALAAAVAAQLRIGYSRHACFYYETYIPQSTKQTYVIGFATRHWKRNVSLGSGEVQLLALTPNIFHHRTTCLTQAVRALEKFGIQMPAEAPPPPREQDEANAQSAASLRETCISEASRLRTFGVCSDGSLIWNGYRFPGVSGLSTVPLMGVQIDMNAGSIFIHPDANPARSLCVFGHGSRFFPVRTCELQAAQIKKGDLFPTFSLLGPLTSLASSDRKRYFQRFQQMVHRSFSTDPSDPSGPPAGLSVPGSSSSSSNDRNDRKDETAEEEASDTGSGDGEERKRKKHSAFHGQLAPMESKGKTGRELEEEKRMEGPRSNTGGLTLSFTRPAIHVNMGCLPFIGLPEHCAPVCQKSALLRRSLGATADTGKTTTQPTSAVRSKPASSSNPPRQVDALPSLWRSWRSSGGTEAPTSPVTEERKTAGNPVSSAGESAHLSTGDPTHSAHTMDRVRSSYTTFKQKIREVVSRRNEGSPEDDEADRIFAYFDILNQGLSLVQQVTDEDAGEGAGGNTQQTSTPPAMMEGLSGEERNIITSKIFASNVKAAPGTGIGYSSSLTERDFSRKLTLEKMTSFSNFPPDGIRFSQAVRVVQRTARRFLGRRRRAHMKARLVQSIVLIQRAWRRFVNRRDQRLEKAVIPIQAWWRGLKDRRVVRLLRKYDVKAHVGHRAATTIQSGIRMMLAKKKAMIQATVLAHAIDQLTNIVVFVQRMYRQKYQAKKQVTSRKQLQAALVFQKQFRGIRLRRLLEKMDPNVASQAKNLQARTRDRKRRYQASRVIQRVWRGFQGRKYAALRRSVMERDMYQLYCAWRAYKTRQVIDTVYVAGSTGLRSKTGRNLKLMMEMLGYHGE